MKTKLLIIVAAIATLFFVITSVQSIITLYSSGSRLTQEQRDVNRLKAQNQTLNQQISQAQQKGYIEQIAHDQLNMVLPGETVVVVPHESTMSGQTTTSQVIASDSNWRRWYNLFFAN